MKPNLIARFLQTAIRALESVESSVQSIYKDSKPTNQTDNPQPQNIVVSSVNLPPAVEAYYEAEHRDRLSKNSRDTVRLVLEVVGLFIAGVLAWHAYKTLDQMKTQSTMLKDQVAVMQKQLEAADRPWVKVDIEPSRDITYTAGGQGQFYFTAVMKNIGHSVATDVTIKFAVVVPKGKGVFTEPVEGQKKLCGTPSHSTVKKTDHELRRTIFPEDATIPLGFGTNIGVAEMTAGTIKFPPPGPSGIFFFPYLVGCVDYTFGTSPTRHQTGFIYEISRVESSEGHPLAFKMGDVVPRQRVSLERYLFGGDYAY